MGLTLLTERYAPQIAGTLSCWDRILLFGTLPRICFAEGMTSYLHQRNIRIFDYPRFAEPFRNRLRENAERLAAENGCDIEFVRKRNLRKEDRVKEILTQRTIRGWCASYRPWSPARPTSRGTTNRPARRTCVRMRASAFTTHMGSCESSQGLGLRPVWFSELPEIGFAEFPGLGLRNSRDWVCGSRWSFR